MAGVDTFPGRSVISAFNLVERMLGEVLHVIPYAPEHEGVWSPSLVTILLEACSQLDSLWKYEVEHPTNPVLPLKGNLNIAYYFQNLGQKVADRWVVLWGEEGEKIQPFAPWAEVPDFGPASYRPLDWWQAYNEVKHDRLANRKQATLRNAAYALAGLFLGILRCPACAEFILQEGWVPSRPHDHDEPSMLLSDDPRISFLVAESALFSHLLSRDKPTRQGPWSIETRASARFVRWFRRQHPNHAYVLSSLDL